jgi:hypothetical protein
VADGGAKTSATLIVKGKSIDLFFIENKFFFSYSCNVYQTFGRTCM